MKRRKNRQRGTIGNLRNCDHCLCAFNYKYCSWILALFSSHHTRACISPNLSRLQHKPHCEKINVNFFCHFDSSKFWPNWGRCSDTYLEIRWVWQRIDPWPRWVSGEGVSDHLTLKRQRFIAGKNRKQLVDDNAIYIYWSVSNAHQVGIYCGEPKPCTLQNLEGIAKWPLPIPALFVKQPF